MLDQMFLRQFINFKFVISFRRTSEYEGHQMCPVSLDVELSSKFNHIFISAVVQLNL
jgi:hypothetical protein